MTKKYGWRELAFDIHLWLGLASGLIVSILCFTGFLLAIHPPLKELANNEVIWKNSADTNLTLPELTAKLPEGTSYTALEIPVGTDRNWKLYQDRDVTYLDPSSGEIVGAEEAFLEGLYRTSFRLHRWMLLDQSVGRPITGLATLGFLLILVSGLVLWCQKCWRKWRRGLLLKRGVSWKRTNYDLHLVLGIYTLIPLFVMAFTGLFWSNRPLFTTVVYGVMEGTSAPERPGRGEKNRRRRGQQREVSRNLDLPYQTILETLNSEFPEPGNLRIEFPVRGSERVRISHTRPAGFWSIPARNTLTFDTGTGQLVEKDLFADKGRADKFLSQVKAIHVGEVWGNFSLLIYILASFLGATLPLTGTIMWWNRVGRRWFKRKSV